MTGELSALLTAFLWSGTSIMFSAAARRVGSLQVNISRLLLAMLLLAAAIAALRLPVALSREQVAYLAVSGLIGLVFGDTFLFRAFKDIGARISMLVMSAVPALSALLAWIALDERMSALSLAGMAVTIAGIALVILERSDGPRGRHLAAGVTYAFFGAVGQAVGLVFAKMAFALGEVHGLVATELRVAVAVAVLLPAALLSRRYRNPFRVFAGDGRALALTLGGAVCGPFLGITLSLVAIAHTQIGVASTIMALPPIIMLPMLRYAAKERISWRAAAGAVVAVAGVALLFLRF
jgi:drug/metabolite transporter (DMT)-like permease